MTALVAEPSRSKVVVVANMEAACLAHGTTLDQAAEEVCADWRMRARLDKGRGPGRRESFSPLFTDIIRIASALGIDDEPGQWEFMVNAFEGL